MPTSEAEVPNYMHFQQDLAPPHCHTAVRAGLQLSRNLDWKGGHITGPPHILDITVLESFPGGT